MGVAEIVGLTAGLGVFVIKPVTLVADGIISGVLVIILILTSTGSGAPKIGGITPFTCQNKNIHTSSLANMN